MTAQQTSRADLGGAVSIGNELEEDQDPLPDGEELPEEDDEPVDPQRVPDPAQDDEHPAGRA